MIHIEKKQITVSSSSLIWLASVVFIITAQEDFIACITPHLCWCSRTECVRAISVLKLYDFTFSFLSFFFCSRITQAKPRIDLESPVECRMSSKGNCCHSIISPLHCCCSEWKHYTQSQDQKYIRLCDIALMMNYLIWTNQN